MYEKTIAKIQVKETKKHKLDSLNHPLGKWTKSNIQLQICIPWQTTNEPLALKNSTGQKKPHGIS